METLSKFEVPFSDKTMIKGTIVKSTIEQLHLLGTAGEEIMSAIDIAEIDVEQRYHRSIRGAIHQTVVDRFGENALFYLGFEQFDNDVLESVCKTYSGLTIRDLKRNSQSDVASIDNQKNIRNTVCDMLADFHSQGSKFIFSEIGTPGGKYSFISDDVIHYTLTNAVYEGHHEFNRASLIKQFNLFLGDYWVIDVHSLEDKFVFMPGLTSNVFEIVFKFRGSKKSIKNILMDLKLTAKDRFLKAVINSSERERKIAKEQSERLKVVSQKIAKYIPPQINQALFKGNYDTEITTRRRKLSIFFSDIKNFTSTSEGLQPEDLTKYLNEYFSEMTAIALNYGATIDKYIGDAMMVFFGDPETKGEREDARACVAMALKMQERMKELQVKWSNEGFADPFQVRIGLNTGYCNVGNFGSDQRLTYTIIGGEVNVAARLETAANPNGILMTYETYAHAQDMVDVEERESIEMKGINRKIKIFSIIGRKEKKSLDKEVFTEEETNNPKFLKNVIEKDDLLRRIEVLEKRVDSLLKKR